MVNREHVKEEEELIRRNQPQLPEKELRKDWSCGFLRSSSPDLISIPTRLLSHSFSLKFMRVGRGVSVVILRLIVRSLM